MEEENLDFSSEVGQLIQHLQKLCKKPQLDDQLSSALEVFQEKVSRQQAYLKNGIFNINFAEAALFLQSCAELYGKKIDLLWDQLLELHTRLIEYDCQHEQEKGKKVDKEVIAKLEERRNRYKRKKKFKLVLAQNNINYLEEFLFEKSASKNDIEAFEADQDSYTAWKKLEYESFLITRIPKAVYKQQTLLYRMKNYYIMKSEDFEIYDPEDGEFNTKYSRIPGWHFIEHIFEYNTKGLLPDNNNVIATLRLSCYLRAQFMRDHNIPFNAPYSQYKEEYLIFKKKFFEEESKKWQNMPLNTMADLHRQLEYLAKVEREANVEKKSKHWIDVPPFPKKKCDVSDCSDCSEDSKFSIITISDSLDKEYDDILDDISKSEAYVRVEKLSSEVIDSKLRQDSGFFELEDEDCDSMDQTPILENSTEIGDVLADCSEKGEQLNENTNENKGVDDTTTKNTALNKTEIEKTTETNENENNLNNECNSFEESSEGPVLNTNKSIDPDDDVRSVISDHDYCLLPDQLTQKHNEVSDTHSAKSSEDVNPMSTKSKIVRSVRLKVPTENTVKDNIMGPPAPKRRKLTQKQIQKLMTSKVAPVREMKFEKFFSMNYQPQIGEGEIQQVDYESDEEIVREVSSELPPPDLPQSPLHENDDVQSIMSDHCYSQVADVSNDDQPNIDDSGFINNIPTVPNIDDCENNSLDEYSYLKRPVDPEHLEEYKRLMKEVEETRKQMCEEMNIQPEEIRLSIQKREQEQRESRERVERWKETITPILNNLQEKEFDIHEYGAKIMEGMQIEESKPFKNIVDGKESAEVVRYFIASLQLANTYNIDLCEAKSGELSNDTLNVKLLKKDRYHEHFVDYQAPSEENFQKNIKRIRQLHGREIQEQNTEPRIKRQRVNTTPRKRKRRQISTSDYEDDSYELPLTSSPVTPNSTKSYNRSKRHKISSVQNLGFCTPSTSRTCQGDTASFNSPELIPCDAESFKESLDALQLLNPQMQIYSSPISTRHNNTIESSSSNERLLFK